MDIRSFKLNFEVNVFIYDSSVASDMENQFFVDINDSELITKAEYNGRSSWLKMKESIIRLLSPIL
jgi:cardiolipin synthase